MRSFNFVVIDLVHNPEGELLAVAALRGYFDYYRTVKDGTELAEESANYYFERKSDIKKIRKSKEKDRMIDRLNRWILQANIDFMGAALEKAEEALFSFADKELLKLEGKSCIQGAQWYEHLPESLVKIESAGRWLYRGGRAYNNYLQLCMEHGVGLYNLQIERVPERWRTKEE